MPCPLPQYKVCLVLAQKLISKSQCCFTYCAEECPCARWLRRLGGADDAWGLAETQLANCVQTGGWNGLCDNWLYRAALPTCSLSKDDRKAQSTPSGDAFWSYRQRTQSSWGSHRSYQCKLLKRFRSLVGDRRPHLQWRYWWYSMIWYSSIVQIKGSAASKELARGGSGERLTSRAPEKVCRQCLGSAMELQQLELARAWEGSGKCPKHGFGWLRGWASYKRLSGQGRCALCMQVRFLYASAARSSIGLPNCCLLMPNKKTSKKTTSRNINEHNIKLSQNPPHNTNHLRSLALMYSCCWRFNLSWLTTNTSPVLAFGLEMLAPALYLARGFSRKAPKKRLSKHPWRLKDRYETMEPQLSMKDSIKDKNAPESAKKSAAKTAYMNRQHMK